MCAVECTPSLQHEATGPLAISYSLSPLASTDVTHLESKAKVPAGGPLVLQGQPLHVLTSHTALYNNLKSKEQRLISQGGLKL